MMDEELKLYRVDDGSVVYWVVAPYEANCIVLIGKCEGLDPSEEWGWDEEPPKIREVPREEAEATTLIDEGEPEPSNMWAGFEGTTEASVMACSEWP